MQWTFDRLLRRSICFKGGGGGGPTRIITDDMKAEAEVAAKEWNRYLTDHLPMEKLFMADKQKSSDLMAEQLRGQAAADIAQGARGGLSVPAGANPSQALMRGATAMSGLSGKAAGAMADVTQKAGDRQVQDLSTLVAMGRGQAVEAQSGIAGLAADSAQAALTKARGEQEARFAEQSAVAEGLGKGVSAAVKGITYAAEKGLFGSSPAPLSTTGNSYTWNSQSGEFDVAPKPAARLSLLSGGLTY